MRKHPNPNRMQPPRLSHTIYNLSNQKKTYIVDNFPCVIVSLRGTIISIRSVVLFNDDSPCSVESLFHTFDICEADAADKLQVAFEAMKQFCIDRKESILKNFQFFISLVERKNLSSVHLDQYRFPYICELPSLSLSFEYMEVIGPKVYYAKVSDSSSCRLPKNDLIVKFVNGNYCADAHYFLAQQGYAPMLYGVYEINYDSWKMIVMEKISGQIAANYEGQLREQHRLQERTALGMLHALGFVHGDVRDTNILITKFREPSKSRLYIIDFDWCSKKNSFYTRELNPKIKWHESAKYNSPMIPEHDEYFHELRYAHLLNEETVSVDELNI